MRKIIRADSQSGGHAVPSGRGQRGMSYIELMIVNFVGVSLLAYSMVNVNTWVERTRIAAIANEFQASVRLARLHAAQRGTCTTICRAENVGTGLACVKGTAWDNGWVVLVNKSCQKAETLPKPLPRNVLLHIGEAPPKGYSLNTTAKTLVPWYLLFDSRGTNASPWLGAHYELRPPSQHKRISMDLCLNLLGQMRVQVYKGYCDS